MPDRMLLYPHRQFLRRAFVAGLGCCAFYLRLGAESESARGQALFKDSIEPLLRKNCYECHSHDAKKIKGGLVLDSRNGWAEGGDTGPAIVPGKPEESLLLEALSYKDPDLQMPPDDKKLADSDIEKFREWIALGAPDSRTGARPNAAVRFEEGRKFWAYQPLQHAVPKGVSSTTASVGATIDAFVQEKLAAAGLSAVGAADRHTLLRRVTFDLTGLPPTPEEIAAFVADARPDAFERVVDRLLDSPAYGEQWARHWLDLACYADTIDSAQMPMREAWRYRDYVVAALNQDKPLDRFITEQLAGDLLPAANDAQRREQLIALGFLAIGPWSLAEQDKEQLRMDIVDHQVMRVGRVFLGMTLDCARCHDHKFDPITLKDYYGLAGIFDSTRTLADELWRSNLSKPLEVPLPETAEEKARREAAAGPYAREEAEAAKELTRLQADYDAAEKELARCEEGKCEDHQAALAQAKKALDEQDKVVRLLEYHRPAPLVTSAVGEGPKPADGRINIRGNANNLGAVVPRGFVAVLNPPVPQIPAGQSGRLELARWLTSRDQPLTARVLANRVWHHLLGAGLVRSVDYFGERGDRPTHPELLDYLALRLRDQGWSLKRFIREIVSSHTYQLASTDNAVAAQRDPENQLLWRAHRRRLDAEMLRDSLLAVSGTLSQERGGEALMLRVKGNLSAGDLVNPPTVPSGALKLTPEQLARRTLYLPIFRADQPKNTDLLNLFDFPSPAEVAGARRATAVPTQSLYLLNAPFLKEQAKLLAARVLGEAADDTTRIERLWLLACGRPPTAGERTAVQSALDDWNGDAPTEARRQETWSRLCHALLGSSAFLYRL